MKQPLVYFAMWQCHCCFIAYTEAEIPVQCPEHVTEYSVRPPELTTCVPPIPYGYAPQSKCICPEHLPASAST